MILSGLGEVLTVLAGEFINLAYKKLKTFFTVYPFCVVLKKVFEVNIRKKIEREKRK
jgi:hypothetical protein